jgi:hypothetical protein
MAYAAWAACSALRNQFFFEQKNQKTFDPLGFGFSSRRAPMGKSCLVLCFKKDLLPS